MKSDSLTVALILEGVGSQVGRWASAHDSLMVRSGKNPPQHPADDSAPDIPPA